MSELIDGHAARSGELETGGLAVLLADDDEVARFTVREVLTRAGLAVDVVEDGRAAIEQAATRRYDAIILDYRMPSMNGLEAARAIRAAGRAEGIPIILLTADTVLGTRESSGAVDHIELKPLSLDTLSRILGLPVVARLSPEGGGREALLDRRLWAERFRTDDYLIRITGLFEARFKAWFVEFNSALQEGDGARLRELLHKARGSAGMVGAKGLERELEACSERARAGDLVAAAALRPAIEHAFEATLVALRVLLDERRRGGVSRT